jgi:hypothetical protein
MAATDAATLSLVIERIILRNQELVMANAALRAQVKKLHRHLRALEKVVAKYNKR